MPCPSPSTPARQICSTPLFGAGASPGTRKRIHFSASSSMQDSSTSSPPSSLTTYAAVVQRPSSTRGAALPSRGSDAGLQRNEGLRRHDEDGEGWQIHSTHKQKRARMRVNRGAPMPHKPIILDSSRLCFWCLSDKHFIARCSNPVRCCKCFIAGHIARQCTGHAPSAPLLQHHNSRPPPPLLDRTPLITQLPPLATRLPAKARVRFPLDAPAATVIPSATPPLLIPTTASTHPRASL